MFFRYSNARTRIALLASAVTTGATIATSPNAATAGTIACNIPQPCALYQNATGNGLEGSSAKSSGLNGTATFAATSTTNAVAGVAGVDSSTNKNHFNSGVVGSSPYGNGVFGKSTYGTGVTGTSTLGYGVSGTTMGASGVHAAVVGKDLATNNGVNDGVLGTVTNGGFGVSGQSGDGAIGGVEGYATHGYGVFAESSSGIGSYSYSSSNVGLYGQSGSSSGVFGTSGTGYGVQGATATTDAGHFQTSGSGTGVAAVSATGLAVYATTDFSGGVAGYYNNANSNGYGLDAHGGFIGLSGFSDSYPLALYNASGTNTAFVDGAGNLYVHTVNTFLATGRGASIVAYATKSTTPNVEDVGSAQLVNGSAAVTLDPTFAATIDRSTPYHVFVTPGGDTHGLYIASKTSTGFIVRETQGGHGSLSFDYRIVASALGQARQRMALVRNETFGVPRANLQKPRPANSEALPHVLPVSKKLERHV